MLHLKKMQTRFDFFSKEALLFSLAAAVGIFIASHFGSFADPYTPVQSLDFTWVDAAILIGVFFTVSFVLARFIRAARLLFKFFFFLIIYSGAQIAAATMLPFPGDALVGVGVVALLIAWRSVLTHNLAIIVGIAGVSALLGLSITPTYALFLLVILSVYDIIAVYRTRHMVQLARGMIESGAIFGFVIPARWRGFFSSRQHARIGQDFMILGSGDIGLPIIFACSIVTTSLPSAVMVAGFSLVGLFITHMLFVNQGARKPMAALPPIATASIIGYLTSFLFF